jgi:hypothetical protein
MKHESQNGKTTFQTGHRPASFEIIVVSDIYIEGSTKVMGGSHPNDQLKQGREEYYITHINMRD